MARPAERGGRKARERKGSGRELGGSWEGGGRRRLESTISVLHLSSATVRAVGAIFFFQHVPAALASACHTTLLEVRIPPCAQPHAVTAVVRPSNVVLLLLLSCPVLSSPVLSCPSSRSRWFEEVSPPQPSSLQTTDSSNYNSSIAKQAAINKFRSGAASRVLTLQSIDLIMKWFYCKLLIEIATPHSPMNEERFGRPGIHPPHPAGKSSGQPTSKGPSPPQLQRALFLFTEFTHASPILRQYLFDALCARPLA